MLVVVLLVVSACSDAPRERAGVLSTWFEQTDAAVQAQGPPPDPVAARTWAMAWWAADRATAGRGDGPYVDAAVATAVHDVLVALVPARRQPLDEALPRDLDAAGAAAGRAAAAAVLDERTGDGLTLEGSRRALVTPLPSPATGVWRPTPPDFPPPAESGLPQATPFLLTSASQLRPGPPPRPGTEVYARDLAEVRSLGAATSTTRTKEQTDVAQFWAGSELEVQVRLLREALRSTPTAQGTRLLSAFHRITADAEIAVFDAKYRYLFWRPITAIRESDPGWTPLIPTPGHPEYPSAHTVYAAAGAAVLERFLGPVPAKPLVVQSAGLTRTYTTWQQAVTENEDARVWAGVHFRTADTVGSELGRAVAAYGLARLG